MATTDNTMSSPNGKWEISASTSGDITLNTSGRYVDRDILIKKVETAAAGSVSVTVGGGGMSITTGSDLSATNNSGVSITRAATSSTKNVTAGVISNASVTELESVTQYLNGVKITAPTSGERKFYVEVPNGTNSTVKFYFHVKANGEVYVTDNVTAV